MEVIQTFNDSQIKELHSLFQKEWWTKGRTIEEIESCLKGSQICIGLIDKKGSLKGFARILTDYIFKAIIFDLIVSNEFRGSGFGSMLISLIKNHPKLQKVKHFELYCLPEMISFYKKYGFSTDIGGINLMRYVKT
ncbi:MAG: GNAT family N-acetyltransferase [Spirochaetota bacterium]|nr:GNAT family N-acetyltransferase [Spirochaetota bacterium]